MHCSLTPDFFLYHPYLLINMPFNLKCLSLLSALTLAVNVSSLAPEPQVISPLNVALAGFVNLNNYQGFGLNLVNNFAGGILDGTAVTAIPASNAGFANQQVRIPWFI